MASPVGNLDRLIATIEAVAPAWIESAPRSGPTVRSSMIDSCAGKAPARSRRARSLALCTVKEPEMTPEPPVIGSRTTGADSPL